MQIETFKGISSKKIDEILKKIPEIRITLIGDICLDVYWEGDMTKSELSRETPHFPLPVVDERISLGAGGNVVANLKALEPLAIKVIGIVGNDWRGKALLDLIRDLKIDPDGILIEEDIWTNAYCKPIRKGISDIEYEDPRIDFMNYKPISRTIETKLLELLEKTVNSTDVICVSDQFFFGCITPLIREKINYYGKQGKMIIVDSRDRIGLYHGAFLKPNEVEGYRAVFSTLPPRSLATERDIKEYAKTAVKLACEKGSKVCMTLGSQGSLYTEGGPVIHIPSYPISAPIDFCGAGDTFLSAFSLALATGVEPKEAAVFANLAAEVAIQKIGTTGTANPNEIRKRFIEISQ